MNTVASLPDSNAFLHGLVDCTTSGSVDKADALHADIKSFQVVFKQLRKTPELLRIMMQNEFNFEGVVDIYAKNAPANRADLLIPDWYKSTFVIPPYSNLQQWLGKCILERQRGNTTVIVIPSRTNTKWFTRLVVSAADELRFIEGRLTMPGFKIQSPFPDCIAIYKGDAAARPVIPREPKSSVGIIACRSSFTDDTARFSVQKERMDTQDEEDNEEEEEEDETGVSLIMKDVDDDDE